MDYIEFVQTLRFMAPNEMKREYNDIVVGELLELAADAITDLLARVESAEAENRSREEASFREHSETHYWRDEARNANARAKNAEMERDAAVSDLRKLIPAWKWDGADKQQRNQEEMPKCGCVDFG